MDDSSTPISSTPIAQSNDIVEKGLGLRFVLPSGKAAFLIRFDGQIRAYLNECRHLPTELDWNEGYFFDAEQKYLICASHGATYHPTTGLCVGGPCRGKTLQTVAFEEKDGSIYLKN